jgi:hypothetical protein
MERRAFLEKNGTKNSSFSSRRTAVFLRHGTKGRSG